VELSQQGKDVVAEQLQAAIDLHGSVPRSKLDDIA
jgi:hypothetical protein